MGNLKDLQQITCKEALCAFLLITVPVSFLVFVAIIFHNAPTQTLVFQIQPISTTPINVSADQMITADWNISFSLRKGNNNFDAIYYDEVEASIYYNDIFLSNASMDSVYLFDDGAGWVPAAVNMSARSVRVEKWVVYAMADEWNNRTVRFNVKVKARVWIDPWTENEKNGRLRVYCKNVTAIVNKSSCEEGAQIDCQTFLWIQ